MGGGGAFLSSMALVALMAGVAMPIRTAALSSSFLGAGRPLSVVRARLRSFSSTTLVMMPEGPEVRTIVDQLQGGVGKRLVDIQFLSGRYVKHGRPDGFDSFAASMTPLHSPVEEPAEEEKIPTDVSLSTSPVDTIVEWNAKGKFIYIILEGSEAENVDFQRSIWITLGMSGQFVTKEVHLQNPRFVRWMIELTDVPKSSSADDNNKSIEQNQIFYHDQRNFGTLKFCLSAKELQKKLESLGHDILDGETTTVETFLGLLASAKQYLNICKFLMNQENISGIGNYILSESLYRARIDPFASIGELKDNDQRRRLFLELQAVAQESYSAQGLTRPKTRPKVGSYRTMDGDSGTFAFELQCYGREMSPNGNKVIRETDGPHGRTIWYTQEQLFVPREERNSSVATNKKQVSTTEFSGESDRPSDGVSSVNHEGASTSLLDGLVDPGWKSALKDFTSSESFQRLEEFLRQEKIAGETIYPPEENIFSALNWCPLNRTKVVIIGQDPYHGQNQAHGLAFSVQRGIPPPPSLKNIFKEAMNDVGIDAPTHGNLCCWAKQGVLLLNSVLTVRAGQANSHFKKGWEDFTDAVVAATDQHEEPKVYLLWGRPASQKAKNVNTSKHVVICTSHPSPLGATKTKTPFLGSKCFSRANFALTELGETPIDWRIQ